MKEELYGWIKNLAVFYIMFTAVLHLVPDSRYERYVRFFMGLLLIFMLSAPVFSILGKGGQILESFRENYRMEAAEQEQSELEDLQRLYLEKGYEGEIRKNILDALQDVGIEPADVSVNIEGNEPEVIIYVEEELSGEERRRLADGLEEGCRIREGQYQIKTASDGLETVGGPAGPGTAPGGAGHTGA